MTKTAITITVAARFLLENGYTGNRVEEVLNALKQPMSGYVYADDVPGFSDIKV